MQDFDFFETKEALKAVSDGEREIVLADGEILSKVSAEAFKRLSFTFTREHLENVIKASLSPAASQNDRYVLACILKNAQVSSNGIYPICQDTGIANVFGWIKGNFILPQRAYQEISGGIENVYKKRKLRLSTSCPSSFFEEYDPKNNMPAQISVFSGESCLAPIPPFVKKAPENSASFVFCAKGGGSSNKTSFIQGTKASLNKAAFTKILTEQIKKFGTSACPPYTIAVVAGGLSPEQNLLTLKLATAGAYSELTYEPNPQGFRDRELEDEVKRIASETGFGAQFGGKAFCIDAIVIRLSRHGASCPISAGVSCSAHRNLRAVITKDGYYLEKTVSNPQEIEGFKEAVAASEKLSSSESAKERVISTDGGMKSILSQLDGAKPGERILLSGKILVARDQAHARWQKLIDSGSQLPEYCAKYPICYAGPSQTPEGKVIGSFGPTTAGRMDSYAESLMSRGAALVTLAKGNRSKIWTDSCAKYGAFYLGTPGGIAALIASEYIESQKILDYEDLGMEAVRLVSVKNLPCFVITNSKGEDFYAGL